MLAPLRTPGRFLAACTLLALTACGATEASVPPGPAAPGEPAVQASPATAQDGSTPFGQEYRFESGLTLMISTPKSFTPSSSAYPRSPRAAAVEVSIYNGGEQPFRPTNLTATAKVDGEAAKQLVDPTQGFNGVADAATDLPPGRNIRLTMAFAMPERTAELAISVQPDSSVPATANYRGPA